MSTSSAKAPRDYTWLIIIVFSVIWALSIHSHASSSNDASRLAAIDSLIARGTWVIDESPFLTVDKIKIGDHFYSDKPPLQSLAGAGVYFILNRVLDLSLQPGDCDAVRSPVQCRAWLEPDNADWAYFFLTFLLVASPATMILVLIYRLARRRAVRNAASLAFVAMLGLGTALWPYSTVFTNHVPAAAAALTGLYVFLTREQLTRGPLIAIGLGSALATALDPSTGVFAIGMLGLCMWRSRSALVWWLVGASVPVLITLILNYQITGTLLLPQMVTSGYNYPGSEFAATVAGNQRAADVPAYMFNLLIGQRGVLLFFPTVAWYLLSTVRAARSTEPTVQLAARVMLVCSLIYFLYFALFTDNYGGYAFSPRWLLNPVPLLAVFAVSDRVLYRPRWVLAGLVILAGVSMYEGYLGSIDPWRPAFPQVRWLTSTNTRPAAVAISGYSSLYQLSDDVRESLGVNDIVPRKFDATRTLVIPAQSTWWFIGGRTPLTMDIAQPLGLNVPTTATIQSDLRPSVEDWLATFSRTVRLTTGEPLDLPVAFGDELEWLGYRVLRQAEGYRVITAWRVIRPPAYRAQRKISFDLTSAAGELIQHQESMGVQYDSLQPGDVVIHVRPLSVSTAPADRTVLYLGVIDPVAGVRLTTAAGADRLAVDWPAP